MMNIDLPAGKYIVAVSGGVDSMVLLDILRRKSTLQLVAAHVDHGIRPDSDRDRLLVQSYAKSHNIVFDYKELNLSKNASEDIARKARYSFLRQCRTKYNAQAIITAHHKDDLIETAVITLIRGTGWRGLAPFIGSDKTTIRPLLDLTKDELIGYARKFNIVWNEDTTNKDENYLRNYVRQTLIPTLDQKSVSWQKDFLRLIRNQQNLRRKIEYELDFTTTQLMPSSSTLKRYDIIMLPNSIAYELLQHVFRQKIGNSLEAPLAKKALLFIKTARAGKTMLLNNSWHLKTTLTEVVVESRQPMLS